MTKIKLCGLTTERDIESANAVVPEYIGFVFASESRRHVAREKAAELKKMLDPGIKAVGVFVNEDPQTAALLLNENVIDLAQLHGNEDEEYIRYLKTLTRKPLIKAFRISSKEDILKACCCTADYVLFDSGAGTGEVFDWDLIKDFRKQYFLAGGLSPDNVSMAVNILHPYAVDVSSGIETNGIKDRKKMERFAAAKRALMNK